jgi:endonuclease YncB( thermonuclease family)
MPCPSHVLSHVLRLIVTVACIFQLATAQAEILAGKVVSIADGDTLTMVINAKMVRMRLAEIDAPEKNQRFGGRSRRSLMKLCFWKEAKAVVAGKDQYGRTVAQVHCDDVHANAEQVKAGMAWVYNKYAKNLALYSLQDDAQSVRRGLWADKFPIAPWQWRRTHR